MGERWRLVEGLKSLKYARTSGSHVFRFQALEGAVGGGFTSPKVTGGCFRPSNTDSRPRSHSEKP